MLTICLDPGHGGKDPGAVGPSGLRESDMNLSVCRMARDLLAPFVNVVMTRETDVFVGLSARAEFSNLQRASAFVAYHFNSAENPAEGFEIFTTKKKNNSDILAGMIHGHHREHFPDQTDRGLKSANFTVISKSHSVSTLVEGEFIHTHAGEAFIGDAVNRQKMARAVALGVLEYLDIEHTLNTPPAQETPTAPTPETLTLEQRVARLEAIVFPDRYTGNADKKNNRSRVGGGYFDHGEG